MNRPILPDSYVNFLDGQLASGPTPSGIFVFVGVSDGTAAAGTAVPVSNPNNIRSLFGIGPLARDITTFFLSGGTFCYAYPMAAVTAGDVDDPSIVVGGFTGFVVSGVPKNKWSIVGKPVVAGDLGVAQYSVSLDGGRKFGPPQVLKATGNKIIGADNTDVGLTFALTATSLTLSSANFSFGTIAPTVDEDDVVDAIAAVTANAGLVFNAFHISHEPADAAAAISLGSAVQTELDTASDTRYKYAYAILQAPAMANGAAGLAFAQALRAGFGGTRVQFAGMPAILKSLGGQYHMSISSVIAGRRSALAPQNSLGLVRAGQLNAVVGFSAGWSIDDIEGIFLVGNVVLIRTIVGVAGFFFVQGNMSDPTSDYRFDDRRMVADLVAADTRAAGVIFLNMDVDPMDPIKSSEPLLAAVRAPADIRVRRGEASQIVFSVAPGQDILTSQELVVDVSILPMAHASWIRFNLGFKSSIAEE